MFDDLFNLSSRHMGIFSDTVRDQFGQSIISDVFEPMLQDISALQQMNSLYQSGALEIAQLTSDLSSMGSAGND
jgi:hypothetical protein